jgi:soluble P-type ATPase
LEALRPSVSILLLSADTFGTVAAIAAALEVTHRLIASGPDKVAALEALGAARCAAIGNGANDAGMLAVAALGLAVVGPEGASGDAIRAADVVCGSVVDALDLLLDERALAATLRP